MGGDLTANQLAQLTNNTTGNCWIEPYPFGNGAAQTIYYPYQQLASPPQACSGDVHVFPCPHCDKCKCGKATVKRDKRGKDGR